MTTIINGSSPSITFSDGSAQTSATRPFQNRIINGNMSIDQRNAGAQTTPSGSGYFSLDRYGIQNNTGGSRFTSQQNAGSVTPPVGFANYLGLTSTSAYSVASGDACGIYQNIEGFNTADLNWGTANAKTVTLSFWVRSSLTGTFGGSLVNSAGNRSYVFSYTISVANTWEQKSITIAGDTSGTWVGATNGTGIALNIGIGTGTTYSGTAGSWSGTYLLNVTGNTSVVGTNGATFYITGVQLEVGSTATSFDYRPYGTELALCYRYYQSIAYTANSILAIGLCTSTTNQECTIILLQTMRSTPTITLPSAGQTSGTISFLTSASAYPATTGTNAVNNPSVNNFVVSGGSYSASFVQGNATWLYPNGNVTIKASAEL